VRKIWLALIGVLLFQAYTGDSLYVSKGNIFDGVFKGPYEKCVFIMSDGMAYVFTTKDEKVVGGPLSVWIRSFEYDGYGIEDVVIVMHNHFASPFFSDADKKTHTRLKMMGFNGSFGVYVTSTDKIYLIKGRI